jgi:bud site selection protein 20
MPAIRGSDSKKKTRRHTRDIDQIHADLHDKRHLEQFHETQVPEELPAFGDFYCVECAKFYESEANYKSHQKSKPHKRRVKALKEEPYSQKEAEAAAGYGTALAKKTDVEDSMIVEE